MILTDYTYYKDIEITHEPEDVEVSLTMSSTGHLTRRSQLTDYRYRGQALDTYNFVDFIVQTYEEKEKDRPITTGSTGDSS